MAMLKYIMNMHCCFVVNELSLGIQEVLYFSAIMDKIGNE